MMMGQGNVPEGRAQGLFENRVSQSRFSHRAEVSLARLLCFTTDRPKINVPNSGLWCCGGTQ